MAHPTSLAQHLIAYGTASQALDLLSGRLRREHLVALAWYSGETNVTVLASRAGVGRDTIYRDLEKMGIDINAPHARRAPGHVPVPVMDPQLLEQMATWVDQVSRWADDLISPQE